jgi:hypothetical protein
MNHWKGYILHPDHTKGCNEITTQDEMLENIRERTEWFEESASINKHPNHLLDEGWVVRAHQKGFVRRAIASGYQKVGHAAIDNAATSVLRVEISRSCSVLRATKGHSLFRHGFECAGIRSKVPQSLLDRHPPHEETRRAAISPPHEDLPCP